MMFSTKFFLPLDLPKFKELKLGDSALMGDRRPHRKQQTQRPCYYANSLTMRNLPVLETLDGSWRYFRYFGHVIMEGMSFLLCILEYVSK